MGWPPQAEGDLGGNILGDGLMQQRNGMLVLAAVHQAVSQEQGELQALWPALVIHACQGLERLRRVTGFCPAYLQVGDAGKRGGGIIQKRLVDQFFGLLQMAGDGFLVVWGIRLCPAVGLPGGM